jgi:hypothetical protein
MAILESAWNFNNNWLDASGNDIDGSAIGATFSSSIKKLGSHSSAYDGLDDAANFGNNLNSVFAGADKKFAIVSWIYVDNLDANQVVLSKYGDSVQSEDQRQFFVMIRTDGSVLFRVHFTLTNVAFRSYITPVSTITSLGWHLIRINYDGSIDTNDGDDRVTIKVNNLDKALTHSPRAGSLGAIPTGTARLATGGYIGSSGTTVGVPLDGNIDTTGIYSGLLTETDDNYIWNSGSGRELPFTEGIKGMFGIGKLGRR